MNCAECRENLVAFVEGLLDREEALQCQAHLGGCAACRAEQAAVTRLQQRLVARGQAAAGVSLVQPVMRRVRAVQPKQESDSIMSMLFKRWGFGLGAAAGASALVLAVLLLSPKTQATAAEVLARGAKAAMRLSSVHLQCRMRSAPAENFANINPRQDFTPIELWRECEGQGRWRIEKPGRVAVMDGGASVLFLRPSKLAVKVPAVPALYLPVPPGTVVAGATMREPWAPFDTGWLHAIADIEHNLEAELQRAQAKGWHMSVASETDGAGVAKTVVTIEARSGLPEGDYLHNKFFDTSDTRRTFRFDARTGRLEGVQIHQVDNTGEVLVFEVTQIAYNEAFAPDTFRLALPADVAWEGEMPVLPDNARYAAMTPEQAARAFFEACGSGAWDEATVFWPPRIADNIRQYLGGLEIVSIGKVFQSKAYPGQFVPYEIKLKSGKVKKHNLALKKDAKTGRWFVDGGI